MSILHMLVSECNTICLLGLTQRRDWSRIKHFVHLMTPDSSHVVVSCVKYPMLLD